MVTNTNSLLAVAPAIAAQWHPEKNGNLQPTEVVAGSNKRVWWQCSREHVWQAYIATRVGQKTGCPVCCRRHRSAIEVALFAELHELLTPLLGPRSVRHHARPEAVPPRIAVSDILVRAPSLTVVVEFDGGHWHQPRTEPDRRKSAAIRAAGHCLIRVREQPLALLHSDDITVDVSAEVTVITTAVVRRMVERGWLPPAAGIALDQYAAQQVRVGEVLAKEMLADVAHRDLEEESLAVTHPELVADWDDAANAPLTPQHVDARTSAPVAWICPLGDTYTAAPRERAAGRGCAVCAGKQVNSRTSLASCRPDLAMEYAASNEKPADEVGIGSHRAVTWTCQVCAHSWRTVIRNRTRNGSGCPACAGKVATAAVNLAVVYPRIAELWHPTLNGALTPQAVRPKSNKAVWWSCGTCGESYQRPVVDQVAAKYLCCVACTIPMRTATRRARKFHQTGQMTIPEDAGQL
ncbi:zinc-ribbon domain-containing protein [Actinacidiphila glaucinigra]|uniref:zinc-ribbon domain-containing protein n=1 Tax=Actinacidiphila glaucinigra TaxID=235986 RepID=UPI0035D6F606